MPGSFRSAAATGTGFLIPRPGRARRVGQPARRAAPGRRGEPEQPAARGIHGDRAQRRAGRRAGRQPERRLQSPVRGAAQAARHPDPDGCIPHTAAGTIMTGPRWLDDLLAAEMGDAGCELTFEQLLVSDNQGSRTGLPPPISATCLAHLGTTARLPRLPRQAAAIRSSAEPPKDHRQGRSLRSGQNP